MLAAILVHWGASEYSILINPSHVDVKKIKIVKVQLRSIVSTPAVEVDAL